MDRRPILPPHMRCAAHTLNLIATADAENALKDDTFKTTFVTVMNKARALWNKQNQSAQCAEKIHESFKKKFVTPNATRWNSVYDSVQCLLDIIDTVGDIKAFNKVITENPIKAGKFTAEQVKFLREYLAVMEPVAEGLDRLQAEKDAYQGVFLPIICLITQELQEKLEDSELAEVRPLTKALLKGMQKRFEAPLSNSDYQLAAAFHPTFRLDWMEDYLPDAVESCRKSMKNLVVNELKQLGGQKEQEEETLRQESPQKITAGSKGKNWLSKITAKGAKNAADDTALKKKANSIIDAWLESSTDRESFTDSVFMGEQALVNLFLKYNTGIPSSAAVERMFSIGKLILRDNRTRLSDDNFERLMFIKGNMNTSF